MDIKENNLNNEPIFQFINPNNNNDLSQINGIDLQELIILLNNYYLELREILNFEQYITFGLEIEIEHTNTKKIEQQLTSTFPNNTWLITPEITLDKGIEINSPILNNTKNTWKELDKVCSIITPLSKINKKSGGHIHIGSQILGTHSQTWLNFLKLWSTYENIIFRFTYGNFLTARPNIEKFAKPTAPILWSDYQNLKKQNASFETIIYKITHERNQAVNFNNILKNINKTKTSQNTIEFRCPNGTTNPIIWQNNVNFLVKLLEYCQNPNFNNDLIDYRQTKITNKYSTIKWYNVIYLEQALELCDLLFTTNLDKIYFLKQYLKDLKVPPHQTYPQTHQLTKIKTI